MIEDMTSYTKENDVLYEGKRWIYDSNTLYMIVILFIAFEVIEEYFYPIQFYVEDEFIPFWGLYDSLLKQNSWT